MLREQTSQRTAETVSRINGEVAVGEDLDFQRSWWRFERFVWVFFVLLIVLDLAGAFGRGPLAYAHAGDAASLAIDYERIERHGTPSMMTLTFGPSAVTDGRVRLFVSESLVSALGAQRIIPQPAASIVSRGGLIYDFPASSAPSQVRIELEPTGAGRVPFDVGVAGLPPLHATVLVVP